MSMFQQVDDSQLQGVYAVPIPVEGVGPHYDAPHFVSYDRAAEQAAHEALPALYAGNSVEYRLVSKTLEM